MSLKLRSEIWARDFNTKIICETMELYENMRPSRGKCRVKIKMRKPRLEHKRTPSLKRGSQSKLTDKGNCGVVTRGTRSEWERFLMETKETPGRQNSQYCDKSHKAIK